jgi:peptidoglycan hydrolase-like protein with peptidoglycan-binding domain
MPLLPLPAQNQLAPTRQLPKTADQAVELAVNAASQAIDTIVDGVQTMAKTRPDDLPATVSLTSTKVAAATPAATTPAVLPVPPQALAPLGPDAASDPVVVARVQRGLASLGFLHGAIDGVAGEATAKAIRNFEVYYDYKVTGQITPDLVNLLVQNGAEI